MASASIDVDDGAFLAAIPSALEEWRLEAFKVIDLTADKVVEIAQGLVAKRTDALEGTIHRDALVRTGENSAYVQVSAGDGTRYAVYQEFGTFKMRAHPYMRPALAMAAGGLRGAGFAARTSTTTSSRAAVKRAAHRQKLRRAVRAGLLSGAEARRESRRVSGIRNFGARGARR
jgi:HK97 gp10 family phage protein